jgi:polyferredoxin
LLRATQIINKNLYSFLYPLFFFSNLYLKNKKYLSLLGLLIKNNNINKIALTKFSVATAVMLVGGLAVVVIPAATTTAYADATTARLFSHFSSNVRP